MLRVASLVGVGFFVLAACGSSDSDGDALPSDSNRKIVCGSHTCTGDDFCCGSEGWGDATCTASCDKQSIQCDDASDCSDGQQCCFILTNANNVTGSQCATSCPILEDRGQLCTTATGDCVDGTCTPMPVAPAGLSQCIKK